MNFFSSLTVPPCLQRRFSVIKAMPLTGMLILVLLLSGCSTQYSYYGRFFGENSAGEPREFLLTWRDEEEDDSESILSSETAAVKLITQCSERVVRFRQPEQAPCGSGKADGLVFCGDARKELDLRGAPVISDNQVCGTLKWVEPAFSARDTRDLALTISCYPKDRMRKAGDEEKNTDFLKASVVPYIVTVKRVEAGSGADRPPAISAKVCEE